MKSIEDAHLKDARFLDKHRSRIALLAPGQSMFMGGIGMLTLGAQRVRVAQTMHQVLEKLGKVRGTGLVVQLDCAEVFVIVDAAKPFFGDGLRFTV